MIKMEKGKPKVISFFTGCGGLDLGFKAAGFAIPLAIEFADYACDTLRLNFPNTKVMGPPEHHGDISKLTSEEILKFGGIKRNEVDVIIGGPPCQPFSVAAAQRFLKSDNKFKRLGYRDKKRGSLLLDFVRLIIELRPKVFLIENVPGIQSIDNGKQVSIIKEMVESSGYTFCDPKQVNMAEYGIPQSRKRLIIIGYLGKKNFGFPQPTHVSDLFHRLSQNTVAHALIGIEKQISNNITRDHDHSTLLRYEKLSIGEREQLGRVDRLDPMKPSKTIIAGGSNGGGRSHLHPYLARTLTVRESARLQTFPDNFVFTGPVARQFTQVGNAVPPLMGEIVGRHILKERFGIKVRGPLKHMKHIRSELKREVAAKLLLNEAKSDNGLLYSSLKETDRPTRIMNQLHQQQIALEPQ